MLRTTLLCLMLSLSVEAFTQELLKRLSYRLVKQVLECREQVKTKEQLEDKIERFAKFWTSEFEFDMWADGCIAECVMLKHGLVDPRGKLKLNNTIEFLKSTGADEEQTLEMIELVTVRCVISELVPGLPMVNQPEHCVEPLLTAMCFRNGIIKSMGHKKKNTLEVSTNFTLKIFV